MLNKRSLEHELELYEIYSQSSCLSVMQIIGYTNYYKYGVDNKLSMIEQLICEWYEVNKK